MNEVKVKQCVITKLRTIGNGTSDAPFRTIVEVWDTDTGEKIAEHDPLLRYNETSHQYSIKER